MKDLLDRAPAVFPLALAVVVPLVGLLLALERLAAGDRAQALRIGLATVIGVCVWAAILTS